MGTDGSALKYVIAVMAAMTAAFVGRSWLQVELLVDGMPKHHAADLSYLVVPPILLLLLFPILREHKTLIAGLFEYRGLTPRRVLGAVAIGVLLRLSSWCILIAGVSFGIYSSPAPIATAGPAFSFDCDTPQFVALGIAVMAVIVPVIEEVTHRGLIQSWLMHRGPVIAIASSAFLFMLFHRPSSWAIAFLAGLVLGTQFWRTRTVWISLITHSTVNFLIQIDWRCLQVRWNPSPSSLPLWSVGMACMLVLAVALISILCLLRQLSTGAQYTPRT